MRKIILMVIIFLLFFSFGCTPKTEETGVDYRTGTQGIVMNFMADMPPAKMYDSMPIDLVVEIKNKGAYPQPNPLTGWAINVISPNAKGIGTLYLSGFDTAFIMGMPQSMSIPSLEGKNIYNSEGGYDVVSFRGNIIDFDSRNIDSYNANFLVTSCYNYETIASQTVCIDPEPYSTKQKTRVCTIPPSYSLSGGQGAPVAVTKVEETVLSNKIQFKIYIKNLGDGEVIDKNRLNIDCPYSLDYTNLDKVYVSGRVSGYSLSCRPNNPIMLINGIGSVICTVPKPTMSRSAYTTPLQVNLEYGYSSSIQKSVEILNTP
ncbi:hypothetical protein FP803_04640 [Candidatus Woesearchaeota archaeon]|nr:hypothetical protein [Candidatus Woesearchaeota archaeon]MBU3941991.1 hypothetical protein [Nanoarchaeota archaeon]